MDERFEDLVAGLGGFYRTWFVYLGLELGLLARIHEAGEEGIEAARLAADTGTDAAMVRRWAWGASAHGLVEDEGGRLRVDDDIAAIVLEPTRPEYLGGQMVHAATASLDYGTLLGAWRTGVPQRARPDRYRTSIERLTVQDIAVFFQEALAALPNLVADLTGGARIVDLHCGGGRWLIAMARRFPTARLTGIEFEADSVARARANVADAGLDDRISIEHGELTALGPHGTFDLAYYQYAVHQLPDPVAALAAAWSAVERGGRLVVMDWYLPSDPDELRTRHGELIAGIQLDETFQGTGLVSRPEALGWFRSAGIPMPTLIDLPSGATVIVAERT